MRYLAVLLALLVWVFGAMAGEQAPAQSPPAAVQAERMPEPVGGMAALAVAYPESARKDGIEGTVYLSLTIGTDGSVKQAEVTRGVRKDLDDAAAAALRKTKWIPAQKNGQNVEITVVLPVKFVLEEKK